jgi:hypothetical protein
MLTPEMIGGIVRALLASLGGWMVSADYLDQPTLQTGIGAVVTLVTIGWSIWAKKSKV